MIETCYLYRDLTKLEEGGIDVNDDHDSSTIRLVDRDDFHNPYAEFTKRRPSMLTRTIPKTLLRRSVRNWSLAYLGPQLCSRSRIC
jgi:hypothetical protein